MPRTYDIKNWLLLLLGDTAIIAAAPFFAPSLCAFVTGAGGVPPDVTAALLHPLPYLVVFYIFDLYNIHFRVTSGAYLARFLSAFVVGSSLLAAAAYFLPGLRLPRGHFLAAISFIAPAAYCWRGLYHAALFGPRTKRRIIIVGAGPTGKAVSDTIAVSRRDDFDVIGFLDDDPGNLNKAVGNHIVIGDSSMLVPLARNDDVDIAVIAITNGKRAELLHSLIKAKASGIEIYDMPSFYEELTGKLPVECLRDGWIAYAPFHGMRRGMYAMHIKRLFDVTLSIFGLLVSLPLCIVTAVLTALDSGLPVLFRQKRVGLNGKPFVALKFRTMTNGTENDRCHAGERDDPRITRIGRVLRFFRIDEIPQLWNVLKGDMSFIGPRALVEEEVREFESKIPYFSLRHCMRSGITGWAQVNYRHGASVEDGYEKLRYDLFYIKNLTPLLDLHILLKTVGVVLFGKGAR